MYETLTGNDNIELIYYYHYHRNELCVYNHNDDNDNCFFSDARESRWKIEREGKNGSKKVLKKKYTINLS